jgi:hypothetical protein
VYPTGNLIQSLVEVSDRESLSETSTPFVLLSIAITSSILVVGGLVGRCVGGQLVLRDVIKVSVGSILRCPGVAGGHEDFTVGSVEAGFSSRHLNWGFACRLEPTWSPPGRGVCRGRRHNMSCRPSGLQACGRASKRICRRE